MTQVLAERLRTTTSADPHNQPPRPGVPELESENQRLKREASDALWEVRVNATTPAETVAGISEFLRLNADTLKVLTGCAPSDAEKQQTSQAVHQSLQTRLAAAPEDLTAQSALVLFEMRQTAKSPEDLVAQSSEFLRLNRESIRTFRHPVTSSSQSP